MQLQIVGGVLIGVGYIIFQELSNTARHKFHYAYLESLSPRTYEVGVQKKQQRTYAEPYQAHTISLP